MADDLLKQYALHGAKLRLAELDAERTQLFKMFPTLKFASGHKPTASTAPTLTGTATAPTTSRKPLSAAAKKAIGQRMKKYWAAKRKERAAAASASK